MVDTKKHDRQTESALRAIPAVDSLALDNRVVAVSETLQPTVVANVVRLHQQRLRSRILARSVDHATGLVDDIVEELALIVGLRSREVINGTGVILQTNLGRAPVSAATAAAMAAAASSYLALETDLSTGDRGGRGAEVEALMRALTGAERTLVVNNNAAAVLLTLAALTQDRNVIVSRAEAVEIGGGFRVPDVLRQSGARLVDVGTTNRTYLSDYEAAINADTAAILRVHASNFAIVGFTAQPGLVELSELARRYKIFMIEDVGSGCLLDTESFRLEHEPTLQESIASGVDVVCASGDKLLGGPQAGLILGRAAVIDLIARHPLARAMRADKTCLVGIAATLRHYARGDAVDQLPVWWSISRQPEWLRRRCEFWANDLGLPATVVSTAAVVGGGSLPGKTLPSFALALDPGFSGADALAARLRTGTPHIIPRIIDGRVAVDARTVLEHQDDQLIIALRIALAVA